MNITATVKYQMATYSGEVEVNCDSNDDNDQIISQAKAILRREAGGSLPYGYESFKVTDR
jgi:hypothetical protein